MRRPLRPPDRPAHRGDGARGVELPRLLRGATGEPDRRRSRRPRGPANEGLTEDYLDPHGVGALLDATLRAEGEVVGVVCHEQLGSTREWTDDEIQFAGDVSDVIHRALRNQRSAERRRELAFRESLLEAQQEAIPDGVLVVGEDGEVLSYNEQFRDLWDIPASVLEDATIQDLREEVYPQLADAESVRAEAEHLYAHPEETRHRELELADGRVFELFTTSVRGDDDTYYGRLWTMRDVTDRRERQRELELKNRAIDESPIGTVLTDASPENRLVYANRAFEDLTGYDRGEVLGRNCRFLQGGRTEPEPVAELRSAIEDQRPTSVELRNYRRDGGEFWNRVTVAPVVGEDGEVTNYVGFQQDVTDRREATRQLQVLHRVLRHNLANEITVIRGTAEQVVDGTQEDPVAAAATILESADQLLGVTDEHREIVRLLSERPAPRPVSLEGVVDRAVGEVREERPAGSVTVEGNLGGEVAAIPAIDTAVAELVRNAVVHDEGDEPSVTVRVEQGEESVRILVSDEGPGLPEEEAKVLTGGQDVEPLYHGLGMGLWLVYWIVTLSDGSVTVEESGPAGTTVVVELSRG